MHTRLAVGRVIVYKSGGVDKTGGSFSYHTSLEPGFKKVNIEFGQQHPSSNSWIKKLHIQISILCMSVVPGPASQDAVFKLVYASPALQCTVVSRLRRAALLPGEYLGWGPNCDRAL